MKTVVVASKNPVKVNSVAQGFAQMFPQERFEFLPVSVPSGVSDQPTSHKETLQGAKNRIKNARKLHPVAEFYVGIEGGVEQMGQEMEEAAWVVVESNNIIGKAKTGTFFLPPAIITLIKGGHELGQATDVIFQSTNSKQKGGAVGALTGDVIDRTIFYVHAVVLALIPFKNSALYQNL